MKKNPEVYIIITLGILFVNSFLFTDAFRGDHIDPNKASQYGAFVGGYIGAIFSLISFSLIYLSLKNQRKTSEKETFEHQFFLMLNLHRENVKEIEIIESIGKRNFVLFHREIRAVFDIVKKICIDENITMTLSEQIKITYLSFYYGAGNHSQITLRASLNGVAVGFVNKLIYNLRDDSLRKRVQKKNDFEFKPFGGHKSRISHYFRHLYQAIKYVDDCKCISEKYNYVKIIRAQLSNHEQALIFLSSYCKLGEEWKSNNLISKYQLIKNLPEGFFEKELGDFMNQEYPNMKFE